MTTTDCTGHAVVIQWGEDGRVLGVSGGAGGTTPLIQIAYNDDDLVETVTDAQNTGRQASYTYTNGNLTAANVLGVANRWEYAYQTNALYPVLTQIRDHGGNYGFTYDPQKHLVNRCTDPNGHYSTFDYDLDGRQNIIRTTVIAFDSNNTELASEIYDFNARKCVTKIVENPGGQTTYFTYHDSQNPTQPTKIMLPDDRYTEFSYDLHGNVLTATNLHKVAGGGDRLITTRFNYSYTNFALGRAISVEENIGAGFVQQATYTYDNDSGLLHTATTRRPGTNDVWDTSTCTYNTFGDVASITTPGAHDTQTRLVQLTYGTQKRGQPTVVSVSGGGTSQSSTLSYYETRGLVKHVQTTGQPVLRYEYNAANQPVTITSRSSTSDEATIYATSTLSYDYVGGPALGGSQQATAGATITTGISLTRGAAGEVQSTQATRTVGEASITRTVASLTYDGLYRPTALRDARNLTTSYGYSAANGFLDTQTYPGGEVTSIAGYDDVGRPGLVTVRPYAGADPELAQRLYHSDPEGLLTQVMVDETPQTTADYNNRGDLSELWNAVATLTPTYTTHGDLTAVTTDYANGGPTGQVISYTYYPDGSRKTMSLPDGTTLTCTYDGLGRLVTLRDAKVGRDPYQTAWSYAVAGQITERKTVSLDGEEEHGIVLTQYAYDDPQGRLTEQHNFRYVNGNAVEVAAYTDLIYDAAGQLVDMTVARNFMPVAYDGDYQFTYAGLGELAHEQLIAADQTTTYSHGYTYDATGNPTSFQGTTHGYNANNQLTDAGFAYDARGNAIVYDGVDCVYDHDNHLTDYDDGAFTAGYRPDGLRAWTREGVGDRTFYLYDGETLVAELSAEGDPRVIVWGANGLISRGEVFYLCDPLGNVDYRLHPNGTIISASAYDAYGTVTTYATVNGQLTQVPCTDPYQYKGQFGYYTDVATGLILCTARYYDPHLGRWLTRDPIGYGGGMNQYGYCGGDPVNLVDEKGTSSNRDSNIDKIQRAIDVIGVFDPTPVCDGANAIVYFRRGKTLEGSLSVVAIVPVVGDVVGKGGKCATTGVKYAVVIGENMSRIKAYAKSINARWYRAWKIEPWNPALAMKRNEAWIKRMKSQGRTIVDIGIDKTRGFRSEFYKMEQKMLEGYHNLMKIE